MNDARTGSCGPMCPVNQIFVDDVDRAHTSVWARAWGLPRREARVASLMLQGQADRSIAAALDLSPTTVRTYARNILQAAGVGNRTQLTIAAIEVAVRRRL